MERDEVLDRIREHLATELEVDPARIAEDTASRRTSRRTRWTWSSSSSELEDSYGVRIPDEEAVKILTVGQAADFVAAHAAGRSSPAESPSRSSLAELPEDLRRQAFTHASWVEHRSESYERLAFLGDVVLSLAVSTHLFPRFERYGAGRLTKVRAQAVERASCARVARELHVPDAARGRARGHRPQRRDARRLRARARLGVRGDHRRGLPELRPGADCTGGGRVVRGEIEEALENPVDYKSVLQERLARRAEVVAYRTVSEEGPAHDRSFERGRGGRAGARPRGGKDEEGRRAGGRPARPRALDEEAATDVMHLRSISMKGFKSFPSRTKLEFGPGVSVIVGPNGSGKSNITDAVLWALGEQSPLAVRGQSMKDVIFAGGHGVQGANAAEVEVVIDNRDGALPTDFSEISIVRKLDRDGEGEYRLNGARCRLVDVLEVLSDSGLGKEMHSVVSQGKVEQIVLSRPRERRLMIEEAAGLGKHRKRRRRAQLKLERTEENLSRSLDVEREARSRLRPLKRQAEAAELHERLERQTLEARYDAGADAHAAHGAELAEAEDPRARRARPSATRRSGCSARWRSGVRTPRRRSPPRTARASRSSRGASTPARPPSGSRCVSSGYASRGPRPRTAAGVARASSS